MRQIWLIIALLFILGWINIVQAGFGISPAHIFNDRLYPGASFETRFILSRGTPAEDLQAQITIEAPGFEDWFSISPQTEFLLPTGEQRVPFFVNISVPKDASYKNYRGYIHVKTVPLQREKASGATIVLGARMDVDLTVTELKIIDFIVRNLKMLSAEQGFKWWRIEIPARVKFSMNVENIGNTEASPDRVEIEVWDLNWKNLIAKGTDTSLQKVKPFDKKDVEASFWTQLEPGRYWTKVFVYKTGTEILREEKLPLEVTPFEMSTKDWLALAGIGILGVGIVSLATVLGRKIFKKLILRLKQ